MKTIEELLKNLARPEVLEFGLVTNRLPSVNIGGKFEPVDDEAPSNERLLQMLVTMGGSRYVDSLSDKPVQWTTRLDGVGVIAVAAIMRKDVVQARFTVARRESVPRPLAQQTQPSAGQAASAPQRPPPVPISAGTGPQPSAESAAAAAAPSPPPGAASAPALPAAASPSGSMKKAQSTMASAARPGADASTAAKAVASRPVIGPVRPPSGATAMHTALMAPMVIPATTPPTALPSAPAPGPPPSEEWEDDDEPTLQTLSPPVTRPQSGRPKPARRPEDVPRTPSSESAIPRSEAPPDEPKAPEPKPAEAKPAHASIERAIQERVLQATKERTAERSAQAIQAKEEQARLASQPKVGVERRIATPTSVDVDAPPKAGGAPLRGIADVDAPPKAGGAPLRGIADVDAPPKAGAATRRGSSEHAELTKRDGDKRSTALHLDLESEGTAEPAAATSASPSPSPSSDPRPTASPSPAPSPSAPSVSPSDGGVPPTRPSVPIPAATPSGPPSALAATQRPSDAPVRAARASAPANAPVRPSGASGAAPAAVATGDRPRTDAAAFDSYLAMAVAARASDLLVAAGRPVLLRVATDLLPRTPPVPSEHVERIVKEIVPARLRDTLEAEGACEFAAEHPTHGRFRVNVTKQRSGFKLNFRVVPREVPTLAALGLPDALASALRSQRGILLVASPAAHGRSTTLAALVDHLNRETQRHVVTIEEPIEHVHSRKKALVSQREVGVHARTKLRALDSALRTDCDVLVVGDVRDVETARVTLSAAEGGRLVIAAMTSASATTTIERLIGLFPPAEERWARATLAAALRLSIAQVLVPSTDRTRLHPAVEIIPWSSALDSFLREGRPPPLPRKNLPILMSLEESLSELVRLQKITLDSARHFADVSSPVSQPAEAGPPRRPSGPTTMLQPRKG